MKRSIQVLPWILLAVGVAINLWFLITQGGWMLDGDVSAEMVLADHLNKNHEILSKDWFYSTEIRAFQSQWFLRVGLLIFPHNWHAARIVGTMSFQLVFLLTSWLAAKGIGLKENAVWVPAILSWPFGMWYLVYALFGTYYLVYMVFSCACIVILCRLQREHPKGARRILLAVGALLAMASGMNGIKQTKDFYVPLAVSLVVLLLMESNSSGITTSKELREKSPSLYRLFWDGMIFTFFNLAGYVVNQEVLSRFYHYRLYDDMYWNEKSAFRLYDVWFGFIKLFGYEDEVKVFSFYGISSGIGIVFGVAVVMSALRLMSRYKKLELLQKLILILFVSSLIVGAGVFCFVGNYKVYYWLPVIPIAIMVFVLEIVTEEVSLRSIVFCGRFIGAIGIILISAATINIQIEKPLFSYRGIRETVEYLEKEGLGEGYASHWSSSVLREASSGEINTWTTWYVMDSLFIYEWLQEEEKTKSLPTGKCFVVINDKYDGNPEESLLTEKGIKKEAFSSGNLHVYVYDSTQEILDHIEKCYKSE